ncbi:IPT/TIG domain-containing protein [Pedobacter sp. SYSU D00535]|uniref:IPT/TIG domain-containing protein n=1 Tax=Pedobacter sp. SYSU D00535 TaxID=2810308 RepID=UPI001A957F41|nr:IPT/TIG domain-containing protein [Pedobacter sp. SYSU D00535]
MKAAHYYRLLSASLIATLLLLFGCKKEETEHPVVQTQTPTAISASKALLKGTIINKGSYEVADYGFVYGTSSNLTEFEGIKVSLGADAAAGEFSKEVQLVNLASYNRSLYARAYLKNSKGVVFGDVRMVQLPSLNVSSLSPTAGKAGDRITINGQFFTSEKTEVEVSFGGVKATVVEVSPTKIIAEVPIGISTSYSSSNQVSVNVIVAGQTMNIGYSFRVLPTFQDFFPKSGYVGSTVTISGQNLQSYYYNSSIKVFFGTIEASVNSYSTSNNTLSVVIPATVNTEKLSISVMADGVSTTLPGEYTVNAHSVSSISPASALAGGSFSIFGNNFPTNGYSYTNMAGFKVMIGNIPVSYTVSSAGQITATVPGDFPVGEYTVTVVAGPHSINAPQKLKVLPLAITGFSPSSGAVGKEITLTGNFNPNFNYQVYFGSGSTNSSNATNTTLRVLVPANVDPGNVKISVRQGNNSATASDDFTVLAPAISSFSPSSGVAGTVVTISGSGFSPYTYNNTVKFGTVNTTILSATESTLRVAVPSNVQAGAMKITVTNGLGSTMVSSTNFTVTN